MKPGLTGSMMSACGGCNIHGSGARWMDGFFLLHVDFHIWVIKFIIWLAAALACDYSGYGAQGALLYVTCGNKGGSRPSPESLCGCWKKNCSVWLLWSGTAFSSVYLFPSVLFPPLFFPTPRKHFFLTLLFAKILVTMATNWRFMSTSSLI